VLTRKRFFSRLKLGGGNCTPAMMPLGYVDGCLSHCTGMFVDHLCAYANASVHFVSMIFMLTCN